MLFTHYIYFLCCLNFHALILLCFLSRCQRISAISLRNTMLKNDADDATPFSLTPIPALLSLSLLYLPAGTRYLDEMRVSADTPSRPVPRGLIEKNARAALIIQDFGAARRRYGELCMVSPRDVASRLASSPPRSAVSHACHAYAG